MRVVRKMLLIVLVLCGGGRVGLSASEPAVTNHPSVGFPVGETLIYRLYWGYIPIGKSRVSSAWVQRDGEAMVSIRYRTKSNLLFDAIYPLDDMAETVLRPVGLLPVEYSRRFNRRRDSRDESTWFNHAAGTALWTNRLTGASKEFPIRPDTRDLIGFAYFMRTMPLAMGTISNFAVVADSGITTIRVTVVKDKKIKLPNYGKVACQEVTPEGSVEGLFIKEGNIRLWAANDARRLGVKLSVKDKLASVHAVLCSVFGPGDDRWVQLADKKDAAVLCPQDTEIDEALETPPVPD